MSAGELASASALLSMWDASVKWVRRWELSQNGWFSLLPQRHSAMRVSWAITPPVSGSSTRRSPRTSSGPSWMGTIAVGAGAGSAAPPLVYRSAPVGHLVTVAMICSASAPSRSTHGRFLRLKTECRLRRQIPVWMQRVESHMTVRSSFSYVRVAMLTVFTSWRAYLNWPYVRVSSRTGMMRIPSVCLRSRRSRGSGGLLGVDPVALVAGELANRDRVAVGSTLDRALAGGREVVV